MLIRIYLTYYAWALFCMNGGWIEHPNFDTGLLNDICWACWGDPIHCIFTVALPSLFLLQIGVFVGVYNWFSSHF